MAAETMYVTVAGGGDKSGSDKDNAMGLAEFEADIEGSCEAGDIYYALSGTYTFTDNIQTARDGSTTAPIKVIGCSSHDPVTEADGDDRPLFACGAYLFDVDDYFIVKNIRATGTALSVLSLGGYGIMRNCKAYNSSGTANRSAITTDGIATIFHDCEGQSTVGYGGQHNVATYSGAFIHCYFHDSSMGIRALSNCMAIVDCIVDTCAYGIYVNGWGGSVINCVVYNCSTRGIDMNDSRCNVILNNIIDTCTVGIYCDGTYLNDLDYNNYYGNGTDVTNCTKGAHATAYDPQFEGAAGGDFRLASGSSCRDAGFGLRVGLGGNTSDRNQGPWEHAAGGGGGAVGSLFNGVIA